MSPRACRPQPHRPAGWLVMPLGLLVVFGGQTKAPGAGSGRVVFRTLSERSIFSGAWRTSPYQGGRCCSLLATFLWRPLSWGRSSAPRSCEQDCMGWFVFRVWLALPRAAPFPPTLSPYQLGQLLALCLQDHFKDLPRGPQSGRDPKEEEGRALSLLRRSILGPPLVGAHQHPHTSLPKACCREWSRAHFSDHRATLSWEP